MFISFIYFAFINFPLFYHLFGIYFFKIISCVYISGKYPFPFLLKRCCKMWAIVLALSRPLVSRFFDFVFALFINSKSSLISGCLLLIVFQVFNGKISEIILDKPKGIYLWPFKTVSGEVIEEMVKLANLFPYIDFHRYL